MTKIIEYFSNKHILTNFIVLGIFIAAVIFWNKTGKEELPDITFDTVSIRASYSGATAEEMDFFITSEIEEAIKNIEGIKTFTSSTSQGSCSIRVELIPGHSNRKNVLNDIQDEIDKIKFPSDMENEPNVREYKANTRPIVDLMLVYDEVDIMNQDQRLEIQKYSDILEDMLLNLNCVSEVRNTGYQDDFIEIQVDPKKLEKHNLSLSQITSAINKNNIKRPLGNLADDDSTKIRLNMELNDIELIKNVIINSSFEGYNIKLKDIADVVQVFEKQNEIRKVNGSEALQVNVVKTSDAGILDSIDQIKGLVKEFNKSVLKDSKIKLFLMDDESVDIRNRITLIASNGLFGFILIIILLFLFLDIKSGIWVAMGIPFSFGFTMVLASLTGNTINNITLAAVIIVMGMVVDDAIVVAENISRMIDQGMDRTEAVVKGTATVFLPILASITTTCVAFIPLFFFGGRFSLMTKFIPPIIFLMLGGSLFEALIILPSHLALHFPDWMRNISSLGFLPLINKYYDKKKKNGVVIKKTAKKQKKHWFFKVENFYGRFLKIVLRYKIVLYIFFLILIVYAGWIFIFKMKYVMFPREETTEISLSGAAPEGTPKENTEKMVREIEEIFNGYLNKEVVGYRTSIARSRRNRESRENVFSISLEILPKDKRKKSANQLIAEWEKKLNKIEGFEYLRFAKSRFGQDSGSAIDIIIKESNDETRNIAADELTEYLNRIPALTNPEIETQLMNPEYEIIIDRDLTNRLSISADNISSILRTILQGNNIIEYKENGEEKNVYLILPDDSKKDIDSLLNVLIPNNSGYLVPLKKFASVKKITAPSSISKTEGKRTIHVYAELTESIKKKEQQKNENEKSKDNKRQRPGDFNKKINKNEPEKKIEKFDLPKKMTPLEIADYLEENVFPEIIKKHPSTSFDFIGEVSDTRESTGDFKFAIIFAIVLIYMILALTLNSLVKPLIIMLSIPFGCVGVILTLQVHGMLVYGFFTAIGALGLSGVVVNDSIVLLAKLEKEYKNMDNSKSIIEKIAAISKTRLRAVILTTITTVAGLLPTAYGIFGYDSMLAEMMLTMAWGLIFGTLITLLLVPSLYCSVKEISSKIRGLLK